MWPLSASVCLLFAPYGVRAIVAVVAAVGATMLLGFTQLALAWFQPLAQAAANLDSWLLAWTVGCVRAVSSLPLAAIPMTPPPAWALAAYDAAVVAGASAWRRGAMTASFAFVIVGVSLIVAPPRTVSHALRITVLDVGQADSTVVQTPRGHTILVDAGGRLERGPQTQGDSSAERVGERIVVPFLLRHGIHAVDAIILSHPHGDHAGGIAPVLRKLMATELADSGQRYGGQAYKDGLAEAGADGVAIVEPHAGSVWKTDDGVALTFIGPSLPFISGSRNDINNNSIAFILQYRSFRMLFTGDAGAEAERRFLSESVDVHADVLKVGHHGSRWATTDALLTAVRLHVALISVGRHNTFDHPSPETLDRLSARAIAVYRTDRCRAIQVIVDAIPESMLCR